MCIHCIFFLYFNAYIFYIHITRKCPLGKEFIVYSKYCIAFKTTHIDKLSDIEIDKLVEINI